MGKIIKKDMINMKEEIKVRVLNHVDNLNVIFNLKLETEKEKLSFIRKLRRLELKGNDISLDFCNGRSFIDTEKDINIILNEVDKLLGYVEKGIPIFFNSDIRGYSLKIDDEYVREHRLNITTDWGGYGILVPNLSR